MRLAVLLLMTGFLVALPRSGAAQERRAGIVTVPVGAVTGGGAGWLVGKVDRALTARSEVPVYAPELDDSAGSSVWTAAAVGAGAGAVVGGVAGYVAYPNLVDPWLTRGQHTALSAAEGVVVGAGVGVAVALIRRWWAEPGAEGAGGG